MSSRESLTADLAVRIRERRDALNLTQREAAEYVGVHERTFQNWEAGLSFPRPRHRRALQQFFAEQAA